MDQELQKLHKSLREHHYEIVHTTLSGINSAYPQMHENVSAETEAKIVQSLEEIIVNLAQAIMVGQPALFTVHIVWAQTQLNEPEVAADWLPVALQQLRETTRQHLSHEQSEIISTYISAAERQLAQKNDSTESATAEDLPYEELFSDYLNALLRFDRESATDLVLKAVESGVNIQDIYLHVFQRSQYAIGNLWQTNQLSVAQEHYCTASTQFIMAQLYPYIFAIPKNGRKLVASCVEGDYHEIGIRMVADFFEMAGWDTYYLGANTPIPDLVQTLIDVDANVLALSATMTYHIQTVTEMIAAVRANPLCAKIIILVGGYPFNIAPDLWKTIGADGFGSDALETVAIANNLVDSGENYGDK